MADSAFENINRRYGIISEKVDKRSFGYRRRVEALQTAPEQIPAMIQRALKVGIDASYVLMDSWFTQQPLVKDIKEQGIDVIGKNNRKFLSYDVKSRF